MIYFISDGTAIKIGRTNDVGLRLKDLQCGNPRPLMLLGSVEGQSPHERAAHTELADFRLIGEWFSDCAEVRAAIDRYRQVGIQPALDPAEDREKEDEIISICRSAADSLVKHEMREGHAKLVAYGRVGLTVGMSGEWVRSFISGKGGEPRQSVGFAILDHAAALLKSQNLNRSAT